MPDNRRRPWIWIVAAVVILAVVAYPLAYGPWLAICDNLPEPARAVGHDLFIPLHRFVLHGPDPVVEPYLGYLKLSGAGSRNVLFLRAVREYVREINAPNDPRPL